MRLRPWVVMVLLLAVVPFSCTRRFGAVGPAGGWSMSSNGLQARLVFGQTEGLNGTPCIVTFLELRNISDIGNVMEVPLKIDSIIFLLRDETGNVIPGGSGVYDGTSVDIGMLRLPHDSSLRFDISGNGAPYPKNQAALLDLGPMSSWTFARGDTHSYSLTATFTIDKGKGHVWAGTIDIPATPLPSLVG